MKQHAIRSRIRRRFRIRTTDSRHPHPIAPNTLARQFARRRPDQAWAADITYIPTDQGWLYLSASSTCVPEKSSAGVWPSIWAPRQPSMP
jgi:transposase InsO family protein